MAALTTDQIVFGEKIPSKALFRVKRAVCTNARLHLAVSWSWSRDPDDCKLDLRIRMIARFGCKPISLQRLMHYYHVPPFKESYRSFKRAPELHALQIRNSSINTKLKTWKERKEPNSEKSFKRHIAIVFNGNTGFTLKTKKGFSN